MNIGGKYWLAVYIENNKVIHKETIFVYWSDEQRVLNEAKQIAKDKHIKYTTVDVTYTHDESF